MLTKKTSAPLRALKFGLVAPLALLFALLFRQAPAIAQAVDEKHLAFVHELESKGWMSSDTVITFNPDTYEETMRIVRNSVAPEADESGNLVYQYAEQQPQFPGGQEAMVRFLTDHLKYPEGAKKAGAEGSTMVRFIVNTDGTISKVRSFALSGFNVREDMLEESERVVLSMPKWNPARHKGEIVRCTMTLPVKFSLTAKPAMDQPSTKELSEVDTPPEYPGGMPEMYKFLGAQIKYPESAKKDKVEGMVVITFVVETDGALSSFKNENNARQDFADEVIRVLKLSAKWKPAMKDGKAMRVKYTLPFKFKL